MQTAFAQQEPAFKEGEWFKFKMSYSSWLKAGNATLTVKDAKLDNKEVYHVVGKGWTTGMIKWFFKLVGNLRIQNFLIIDDYFKRVFQSSKSF